MYKIMVIDDEPIILNGVCDYLKSAGSHLDLDIYKSKNAFEAIRMMQKYKMDIVLTDIRMPGMSGLELQQKVLEYWPRVKVIFLTGYDDFNYVHDALRNGALDYIMKTEGYEKILEVIEKTIRGIQDEMQSKHYLEGAKRELKQSLWQEFVREILFREDSSREAINQQLRKLDFPLHQARPFLLVIGQIDGWNELYSFSDRSLMLYAVKNIAEEYLDHTAQSVCIVYNDSRLAWMIQPNDVNCDIGVIHQFIESIQHACKQTLTMTLSFIMASEYVSWEGISAKFKKLNQLSAYRFGSGEEALLNERSFSLYDMKPREWKPGEQIKKMSLLSSYLEQGKEQPFYKLLNELLTWMCEPEQPLSIRLEIFHSIGLVFISFLNHRNMMGGGSITFELEKMTRLDSYASHQEISTYFRRIAEQLFTDKKEEQLDRTGNLIARIQHYIQDHIAEDLTLITLAEVVYLNPSYLSRLYKQMTGMTISDYITGVRIDKAKSMLKSPKYKIQDISVALGFDSASYFTQFFKKNTGYTPLDYRALPS